MAKIPTFDDRARTAGTTAVSMDTGADDVWLTLARGASQFAARMGGLADRAAATEGGQAGLAKGFGTPLPAGSIIEPRGDAAPTGAARRAGGPRSAPVNQPPGGHAAAISAAAAELGVPAIDLATVISYETAGRFSPSIRGGKNNNYLGLIQFGPEERRKYGVHAGQSFDDQLKSAVRFLKDRGVKPGMGLLDLYSTVNAGSPGRYNASDGPGNTVRGHVQKMMGAHRSKAAAFLGGAATIEPAATIGPDPVRIASATPQAGFTLHDPNSIYGAAFNRAARATYGDRIDMGLREQIAAAEAQHPNDPEALAQKIDTVVAGFTSGIEDAELNAAARQTADRLKFTAVAGARRTALAEERQQALADFNTDYERRRTDLFRTVHAAPLGDKGDAAVAGELGALESMVRSQSDLTPASRQKLIDDLQQDVLKARLMGQFDNAPTPAARQAMLQQVNDAWKKGEGSAAGMTPETFEQVQTRMASGIRSDQAEAERQAKALERDADGLMTLLKGGHVLPDGKLAALRAKAEASGSPELAASVNFLAQADAWTMANRQSGPAALAAQINRVQQHMDEHGATPAGVEMLDLMEGVKKSTERGLRNDMLGHAERVGLGQVPQIDMTSPDALVASLSERAVYADAAARQFGVEPQYFRPREAEALQKAVADNPDFLVTFAHGLSEAFGSRSAAPALEQLSKDAPVLAHAAGVATSTDDDRVLRETAVAISRRALPDYKPVTLTPARQQSLTLGIAGNALQALPATQASAVQQAQLLFEQRVHGRGIDPGDGENEDVIREIWQGALNDALGAHEGLDGEAMGGLAAINGQVTLVPPEMGHDQLQTMMDNLSAGDLDSLPPIASANGLPIATDRIRQGKLVAVGNGQYRVALGDPASAAPQWLMGQDGRPWVLDAFTLDVVQKQRPALAPGEAPRTPAQAFGPGSLLDEIMSRNEP